MGNYSKKQGKFANYLCEHFGMTDSAFISQFLNYYSIQYGSYQQYQSGWYFNSSAAISALIQERDIRRKRNSLKTKSENTQYLRATDIANYTFCPVSYSISNSFEIEYPSGEKERITGEKLHNQLKLISRVETYKKTGEIEHKLFDDPSIINILKSTNIYSGHQNEKETFFDKNLQIASEPDYIFKDNLAQYFVVEEKFQYRRDPSKPTFFDNWLDWNGYYIPEYEDERLQEIEDWNKSKIFFYLNHQVQLITYLKAINEYDLKYGYLVYWYYDYRNGDEPYIHKVATKKIKLDNWSNTLFQNAYNGLKEFIATKEQNFSKENMSANKCGGCVVNKYCGHKNKRYDKISLPYDKDYLSLFAAKYED